MTNVKEKIVLLNYFVFAFLDVLIALRILFIFLNANVQTPFVNWLYATTQPLVAPFINIFPTPATGAYTIELGSILALLFYAILGYVIGEMISFVSRPH